MIPLKLTLKNFLSYREATLDFRGLHTACICGPNGAGKSSLLEAITWVIWGQSRAASEEDAIHAGAKDVRVDFIFKNNQQTYRLIRTRQRGQSSSLEFQIETPEGFRSLTEKGVRATQQLILHHLKLDYDTFINSAYLRQGRADEFMLKRPSERKQILADLLKLSQYEELAEQAKDLSRQFKGQAEQLNHDLQATKGQLEQRDAIAQQQATLETTLQHLQQTQDSDRQQLQHLQTLQHQRHTWEQQLTFVRQQYQNLGNDCDRLQQDIIATEAQQQQLATLINQDEQIAAGYSQYLHLQQQDELFTAKFQAYQEAQQQKQHLQQQLSQQINELNLQIRQTQAQLDALFPQEQEIQEMLSRSGEIAAALEQLNRARGRLSQLDSLQLEVSPLLQRRTSLQTQLDRAQARLTARLDELRSSESQLNTQISTTPQLRQTVLQVGTEISQLEKKRVYQQRVQEKGLERRSFQERLQENQRRYEKQLAELTQKIQMLQAQDAICPLCDRPLDEAHGQHVIQKTTTEQQEIQEQFWVVREQLAVCERELQVLRQEYSQLAQELAPYETLLEQRGQLEARLEATDEVYDRLYDISEEKKHLERSLSDGAYALELQAELRQIDSQLQQLNYNEQTHALARNEVDRWRWAEIKSAKLEEAQRRQGKIDAQKPQLQAQIDSLHQSLHELQTTSPLKQKLDALDQQMAQIGYNLESHNNLRASLRQAQSWQLRYQELTSAQQQYPQVCQRVATLTQTLQGRRADLDALNTQVDTIVKQLENYPDATRNMQMLEQQMQERRRQLDEQLSNQGRLQQRLTQLESLQRQYEEQQQQLQNIQRQYRVHQELAQAFGKNGIQALMIENILPQLEAETNQILSRLTGNQLHVQIVTQKAGRRASKKKTKLIDTLDILIADASGTRSYETYSGGEAFRINFSIRLALARLLAQRAGTSLQMLIVDEGFGTQDSEGCERLIAAINAIASDFSCILTVTHMPQFKEAFQTRIEVRKTERGSQLSLGM
ncbi:MULTISPECIES: exonuclease subunit SbcC [unclassified Coleofasciculus]|uniref:exonuclease subunit SbcC n=1 Tax=unclassified Coleofasciculus TaxID=2692782 RepID=UPI001881D0DC|nr:MULTISPECIES: exonuclease subunit SbcC [unclassified Coleofasciculus]MBE9127770.1 exonuclease subunit SbcC [Coleofasciculus sp. LEGE 07081]MBE9149470.1 exonuclease subunit SbcC [Coleofasciculus sp. LEGE 07092]